jgi:hypothetical protein
MAWMLFENNIIRKVYLRWQPSGIERRVVLLQKTDDDGGGIKHL